MGPNSSRVRRTSGSLSPMMNPPGCQDNHSPYVTFSIRMTGVKNMGSVLFQIKSYMLSIVYRWIVMDLKWSELRLCAVRPISQKRLPPHTSVILVLWLSLVY